MRRYSDVDTLMEYKQGRSKLADPAAFLILSICSSIASLLYCNLAQLFYMFLNVIWEPPDPTFTPTGNHSVRGRWSSCSDGCTTTINMNLQSPARPRRPPLGQRALIIVLRGMIVKDQKAAIHISRSTPSTTRPRVDDRCAHGMSLKQL